MITSKGKMEERTVDSIIARERKGNDMYGVICNVPDDKLFI
jgi:hypothetical protein